MSGVPALEGLPDGIRTARDYQAHAHARLSADARDYIEDHAGTGVTLRANRDAWDGVTLWPRVLRGTRPADLSVELAGRRWPTPLLVAPMALQRLVHRDGELATTVAAAVQGAGMVVSHQTSVSLATLASAVRDEPNRGPLWFQLSLLQDRGAMLELVRRVETAGYEALVLTVDAALRAPRPLQLPAGVQAVEVAPGAAFHSAPRWDDVAWLQGETRLPMLLKGILHPADAREAAGLHAAGLIVSNHGGRILDGAPATAIALPLIADAFGSRLPLLVDGGIACGADVLKALALGARAVLVGRPVLHGLAAAGAAGAAHVLRLIQDELALALGQCGIAAASDVTAELIRARLS
jgi:4-hydroxymandelate oxidase